MCDFVCLGAPQIATVAVHRLFRDSVELIEADELPIGSVTTRGREGWRSFLLTFGGHCSCGLLEDKPSKLDRSRKSYEHIVEALEAVFAEAGCPELTLYVHYFPGNYNAPVEALNTIRIVMADIAATIPMLEADTVYVLMKSNDPSNYWTRGQR